jgi:hypothetical protein
MPTPNFIKYSTTPDSSGIKVGNYTIGVFSGGTYGPTSTTNYWNGITPPISGYTIYENKAANGPSIRVAADASVLIDYTRRLYSGSSVTTEYSALTYLNSLGTVACVNRDYEEIITSGLTLNLDAGFTPSYPKSGTTWTDISFSGNNGTLVNGPTFNSANGGSIVFDGVDDYVSTTYNSNVAFLNRSPYTLEVFVNPLSVSQYPGWIDREANLGLGRDGYNLIYSQVAMPAGSVYVFTERFATGSAAQAATTLTTSSFFGNWSHLVSTYNGSTLSLYVNGILMGSSTSTGNITNGSTALQIGRRGVTSSSGKIAISRIYNRALTNVEILQNYQSQFPRFLGENIVTNGLVNYLDAGFINSYPTTGTTWFDVSGYGRNGTLTNGPTYSNISGGTIVFDGTDDYVTLGTQSFITNDFTVNLWYNLNTNTTKEHFLFSIGYSSGNSFLIAANSNLGSSQTLSSYYLNPGGNATGRTINSITVGNTVLVNLTYTRNNGLNVIYINGVEQTSRTFTESLSLGSSLQYILGYAIPRNKTTAYLQGNIYISQVYNRSLTQSEILQNFNAQKSRFGL